MDVRPGKLRLPELPYIFTTYLKLFSPNLKLEEKSKIILFCYIWVNVSLLRHITTVGERITLTSYHDGVLSYPTVHGQVSLPVLSVLLLSSVTDN